MKTITKPEKTSSIDTLKRQMDRFFDDLSPFTLNHSNSKISGAELMTPDTDMVETKKDYVISIDLPGFQKKDIEINFQDNRLTIKGSREEATEEEERDYLHRERYFGEFIRTVTMPTKIKEDQIKATFKEGVLTVKAPKIEVSKPKAVEID